MTDHPVTAHLLATRDALAALLASGVVDRIRAETLREAAYDLAYRTDGIRGRADAVEWLRKRADALMTVVRDPATLADDEALVRHLSYEVMNEEADLADRQPPQSAWDDLDRDVRQMLRLLPAALTAALTEDAAE